MVVGGVLFLLFALAVALPHFGHRWLHDHHGIESTEGLDKIKEFARRFYVTDRHDGQGNLLPRRFPQTTPLTPPKPHCERAATPMALWAHPGWKELQFYIEDPHYYSFEFKSAGTGAAAVFTARSLGDLDCDGVLSTFELRGFIDKDGKVQAEGPIIWNEIE